MGPGRNVGIRTCRAVLAPALAVITLSAPAAATPAATPPAPTPSAAASGRVASEHAAQSREPPASPEAASARRMARDAQRAFEHVRRRNFPRGPLVNPKCGEGIGRFCLVEGWDDDDWEPVPEEAEVLGERHALIAVLDSAARIIPGDEWLTGQRVAYRLEAGGAEEALALLESCRMESAWCAGLAGFVLQESGRYAEAESAFERALGRLTEEERCRWTALGPVLDRRTRGRYERFACGSSPRRAVERSFWHLSDPLWLAPGLERRSEHLARRVRAALQADAASPWGMRWGDDLTEITLRFGWPAGWERARRRFVGSRTDEIVWSHRLPGAQRFTVVRLGPADDEPLWELDEPEGRTSWAPVFGEIANLPHQVASFRRDGRRRVVAAFTWPDSLPSCDLQSGLFLADAHGVMAASTGSGDGPLAVAELREFTPATFVGVEARCDEGPGAARARMPLAEGHPLLSDILLLDAGAAAPATLSEALARARGARTARAGETLGVYWEWYGPAAEAAALEVTLSLAREGKGFWRRALEWSGLARDDTERAGIRWLEAVTNPGAEGRTLELRLPMLDEGQYRLTLQVASPRHGMAESSIEIEIVAASPTAAVRPGRAVDVRPRSVPGPTRSTQGAEP
ncbi:hypothetical protein [Candidatus Palauibacter polyketidifaciens]|uniref:hypothetical protein n=1 Tax=Candidatus Palauibacter polyketidifaciens TaxID=3056740 RepID=UPI0023A2F7DE|nr:hypothetical protein [Candidatus Palauibacter polyketidifaciens]MDE2719485.1 hypothetical protein [Candidatus Palauibacter polyketidifaciens]